MARTAVREGLLPESFEAVGRSAPQTLPAAGRILSTFSPAKRTSGLELTNSNRTATHKGSATGWQIAVCEPSQKATFFTVRIEKNPRHRDLHIGFTLRAEALQDMTRAAHNSWQVGTGNQQLYERGLSGPCGRRRIDEKAVITVEKDRTKCALRFYVNGEELQDKNNRPYGWRPTGLQQQDFDELVGCVWLWYIGDEVSIVPEPDKLTANSQ